MNVSYQQQYPQYAPQPRNGFGITALVLALIGAVFALIPLTGFMALILGGLAFVFGLMGLGRARKGIATNRTMSAISTGLGVLVAAAGIWGMVILFQATDQFVKDMDQISQDLGATAPAVSGGTATGTNVNGALADVVVSGCKTESQYGSTKAEADVTVTNSTDRARSYWATIAVDDAAGNRLGEIAVTASELQPGQVTHKTGFEAMTMVAESADEITCKVVEVNRF
ncbi:hypothetical protein [Saccharopolyspora tripterygii]